MEDVNAYLALTVNYGYGYDNDFSNDGNGSCYNDGSGYGSSGYGSDGYDFGNGGYYNGYGGDGFGCSNGNGIKNFCGDTVYVIDGVQTIIKRLHGVCAKGFILHRDLTLEPCYVVKYNNCFAHGRTLREARNYAFAKAMHNVPIEDRIAEFWKNHNRTDYYSVSDFFEWHNRLTGSCEMGRREFAKSHGVDIENGKMTVEEFINLTENAYGGEIIKKLRECASGEC